MSYSQTLALSFLFFILSAESHVCDAAEVTGVQILEQGLMNCVDAGTQAAPGTPTGKTTRARCEFTRSTNIVPATIGRNFGCKYRVLGTPTGQAVVTSNRWRFPTQGLNDPHQGKLHYWADYTEQNVIGEETYIFYRFEENWELVPGNWVLEISNGTRKLAECRFTVVMS